MAEKITKTKEERLAELEAKKQAEIERHKQALVKLEEEIGVLSESRMPVSQKWKNLFAALKKEKLTPEKIAAKLKLKDVDFGPQPEKKPKKPKDTPKADGPNK